MQALDELELVSRSDLRVRHFFHDGLDQVRPSTAQCDIIQRSCANPFEIRWLSLVEQCEFQLLVINEAFELYCLVAPILVGVSDDVGQGLVDCQPDSDTFFFRQTICATQLVYRSSHDRQEAGVTRHT